LIMEMEVGVTASRSRLPSRCVLSSMTVTPSRSLWMGAERWPKKKKSTANTSRSAKKSATAAAASTTYFNASGISLAPGSEGRETFAAAALPRQADDFLIADRTPRLLRLRRRYRRRLRRSGRGGRGGLDRWRRRRLGSDDRRRSGRRG